jgi:hypothetical protein
MITQGLIEENPGLNLFLARFRIARNLPTLNFAEMSTETSESYRLALQLGLSYAALESLQSALGKKVPLAIHNDEIFVLLSKKPGYEILMAIESHPDVRSSLKARIAHLMSGESDNLQPLAYALRNLMFHGSLTATHLGLNRSKAKRSLISDLNESLLWHCEYYFDEHIDLILSTRN